MIYLSTNNHLCEHNETILYFKTHYESEKKYIYYLDDENFADLSTLKYEKNIFNTKAATLFMRDHELNVTDFSELFFKERFSLDLDFDEIRTEIAAELGYLGFHSCDDDADIVDYVVLNNQKLSNEAKLKKNELT